VYHPLQTILLLYLLLLIILRHCLEQH